MAEKLVIFPAIAAQGGQGTIGSLRRFFGDFLSLVKESYPSETGQGSNFAGTPASKAPARLFSPFFPALAPYNGGNL